jgi:hypothetical protein
MPSKVDVAANPGKYDGTALDVTLMDTTLKGVQTFTTLPNPEGWSFPNFSAFFKMDHEGACAWFASTGVCGHPLNLDALSPGQRGRMGLAPSTTVVLVSIVGAQVAPGKWQNNGDNPGDGATLSLGGKTYVYRQRNFADGSVTPFAGYWELA